jgi:outer membrane protein
LGGPLFRGAALALILCAGARAETLDEALIDAYTSNPALEAERALVRATDEGVPQALAGWRPTVQFQGAVGALATENTPATPPLAPAQQFLTQHIVDLNVTQNVYQGGRTVALTAQAEAAVRAERARALATEGQVFLTVVQAYFDVLRDLEIVRLNRENEDVLRRLLETTKKRHEAGELTSTDVAEGETHLSAATASRTTAEGQLGVSRANYLRITGHVPQSLAPVTLRPVLPKSEEEGLLLAATKNFTVLSAIFGEEGARDAVAATQAQLLPSVNIIGDVNRSPNPSLPTLETTQESIVARVTVPLYEGGTVYSQTRQAIETVAQRKALTDDARRVAAQGAGQAWQLVQAARATMASLASTIRTAQQSVDNLRKEQEIGTRSLFEVLTEQQALFNYRLGYAQAEHDERVAEFTLSQQIGTLTAADLKLPVVLYDMDQHYQAVRDKWLGLTSKP